MSRSYKKFPGYSDSDRGHNFGKKMANKKVRKFKGDIPEKGYSFLKKLYNSWNICDYNYRIYYKIHSWKWKISFSRFDGSTYMHLMADSAVEPYVYKETYEKARRK